MKGQRTLFSQLFPKNKEAVIKNRGRNKCLMSNRHKAMAIRYYYHAEFKNLNYDDCIKELTKEFYLDGQTIVFILQNSCLKILDNMIKIRPSLKELKNELSFFYFEATEKEKKLYERKINN